MYDRRGGKEKKEKEEQIEQILDFANKHTTYMCMYNTYIS